MNQDPSELPELLERSWQAREEIVYRRLFGDLGPGIYTLSAETFEPFARTQVDPRWLHCGVFVSPPSPMRPTWLYVSSGLSNTWWDTETRQPGVSGLGCEFLLELPEAATWGILHVQNITAFQLLLAAGHYPNRPPLEPWDRIPLKQPIDAIGSLLRWLLVVPPDDATRTFHLESGRVRIYTLLGLTDAEAEVARDQGGDRLLDLLRGANAYPVTQPARRSVVSAA
jgi:hypothetical protein